MKIRYYIKYKQNKYKDINIKWEENDWEYILWHNNLIR